jgi:hypothetical protein
VDIEMQTIAFPLIYLMVAINPATGQWQGVYPNGEFDDAGTIFYPDQKTCLAARQEITPPGTYFCLAYKDTRYMMEVLQKGHWLPLNARDMTYGAGHGVPNQEYPNKTACLTARPF